MTANKIIKKLQEEILNRNQVRLHISQIDYEEDFKYNVLCGIYVNSELKYTFEIEDTSNKEIESFKKQVNTEMNKLNNVYLI